MGSTSHTLSLRELLEDGIPIDLPGDLLRLYGPLISIFGTRVELCHQTVKDYFVGESKAFDTKEAHCHIAEVCARAIDGAPDRRRNGSFESVDSTITIIGGNEITSPELLGYAARYWADHVRAGTGEFPAETTNFSDAHTSRLFLRQYRTS
jgi:hypothetical protein